MSMGQARIEIGACPEWWAGLAPEGGWGRPLMGDGAGPVWRRGWLGNVDGAAGCRAVQRPQKCRRPL